MASKLFKDFKDILSSSYMLYMFNTQLHNVRQLNHKQAELDSKTALTAALIITTNSRNSSSSVQHVITQLFKDLCIIGNEEEKYEYKVIPY